jgi:hypothetical protein
LATAFKPIEATGPVAAVNAFPLVAFVRTGAQFEGGKLSTRSL